MSKRSIVYIDGFNLYYGAVQHTRFKWLNLERLFERLRQDDDIQVIRFFTALIDGPREAHQAGYLQALATCPKVEVILGRFKRKQFTCRVRVCNFRGRRVYTGLEEKRTDVAIAVNLLDDAYQNRADRFIVVSGDSDLVPAIHRMKENFPHKQVVVYVPARNPTRGAAVELRTAADRNRTLPMALIAKCQFPEKVPDGLGGWISKPAEW
jgi:uncharacterized LabA/DUF88 family protein